MARYRTLAAPVAFALFMIFGYPVKGQVFVHTILDQPTEPRSPDAIEALTHVRAEYKTLLKTYVGSTSKTDAEIDKAIAGLSLPKTTDQEADAMCKTVALELNNRWLPVRWNSNRSACVWGQRGLDFGQEAQIVGGGSQGTASVEIAADYFWGLRVRVQSSVTGTDSTDKDAQAKAALKQLQTAGGNVSFGATYPWRTLTSGSGNVTGLFTSYVRVAGAVPALGSNNATATIPAKDANGNVELAPLDAMLLIKSFKDKIELALTGRQSFVNGTHAFNDQVKNTGHRGFMYNQLGVGLRFQDVVWVVASRANYSHKLPGGGMTYSVVFGKKATPPAS